MGKRKIQAEELPEEVRKAILTLGKYCAERDCLVCAFAKESKDPDYRVYCPFDHKLNPVGLVEVILDKHITEMYDNAAGTQEW